MPHYRFGHFVVSPRRRVLIRNGSAQPLIPRYFDLLLFLLERRGEAVHRREIFDRVWTDVVVSDSALTQAIRTIRRVLDDDPREPRFVRTVSRYGYEFVFPGVIEEDDTSEEPMPAPPALVVDRPPATEVDPFTPLVARLTDTGAGEDDRREAAEQLHALGTTEALRRLEAGTAPPSARALLRDTRWDSPGAGAVPIAGRPDAAAVAWHVIRLRGRRAARLAAARWASASLGGGGAGAVGGAAGGLLLTVAPDSTAPLSVVPVLALVGAAAGAAGAAGVGAGLTLAEAIARSHRAIALLAGGAIGGGAVGLAAQVMTRWSLTVLVGIEPAVGGPVEGLTIGLAAGLAYGLATRHAAGGLAAPRGGARIRLAAMAALACGLAALGLVWTGRPLVGGTVHLLAQSSTGAQAVLSPLGRLIGEPGFGPVTAALISLGEGAAFGFGLAFGLTTRRS